MYYGLQLSASGILTGMYRTDALASNLANINTTGFKPDMIFTRQRSVVREEDGVRSLPSNTLLEKLGAGVHMAANQVNHEQGPVVETGNALDVALQGNGFFVVRDSSNGDADGVRLTRDGRFTQDANRRLVSATTGMPVMGTGNAPIILRPNEKVTIDTDGTIRQNGAAIARLQVIDVPDRRELTREGSNLFSPSANAYTSRIPATGRVIQGSLENSGVSEIGALLEFQAAAGAVAGNTRMAGYHDDIMNRAINTFGRIA